MSQATVFNIRNESGVVLSVTGTNGVTASPTTGNVVVSGVNATTSTVGVASFNPSDFTVSGSGEVTAIDTGTITSVTTSNATPQFALTGTTENINFQLTNLVLGSSAASITSAVENVGIGSQCLNALTSGTGNVAVGFQSLLTNTTGGGNTAVGLQCLKLAVSSSGNTCIGQNVMSSYLGTGTTNNTGVGDGCLQNLGTGEANTCMGKGAGSAYTTSESSNIIIGNSGVITESNVIRIGTQGTSAGEQNTCYIAGITGKTPQTGNTPQVTLTDNQGNVTVISSGTSGYVLTSNGSATPSFQAAGGGGSATAFFAYRDTNLDNVMGGGDPGPYTIICDATTRNDGSNYSASTGLFTAPSNGFYCFCATIYLESGAGFTVGTEVLVSQLGSVSSNVHYQKLTIDASNSLTNICLPFTWMLPMAMGDTMGIAAYCNNANQDVSVIGDPISNSFFQTYTSFSGFLVGA